MMKMLGKTGCFTQEENQILYQIFCSSVQEKKKLGIALENILYQEEVEKVIQDTYLNYIKRKISFCHRFYQRNRARRVFME